ncbi:MAG: prepilin-type N-terminal cleavage/methylation domain-containing protein [Planctomycetes bacterium]|nr:prepilin-type N-terminal cleavage/methylation domain-containing protein [Planctomycetota bacterium]
MKPYAASSAGFTLLELTLAVSVMASIGGLAIRGLSTSLRDAAVDAGARTIEQASGIARQLAVNPAGRA